MILYPAIDILGGRAVRLTKGDFDAKKVYEQDPLDAASAWVKQGAKHLHVVDLDGAKDGQPRNLENLARIASELLVPVQYGGGLRSIDAVQGAIEAGAKHAILGTAAFKDPELLEEALARWAGQIIVSVDVRGGLVSTAGWTQSTQSTAMEAIAALRGKGVAHLVYTDVDRDGMLEGPDVEGLRAILDEVGEGKLVYSGGIGSLSDLDALAALKHPALFGVIVGKALYERRFTVKEALASFDGSLGR